MTDITTVEKPRVRWGWWIVIGVVAALLVLTGIQLVNTQRGQVARGQPAPDFTVTSFDGTPFGGETFQLSQARGKVVLVNFWASWCLPCREEAAALEAVWQMYRDRDFVLVGLAWSDTERESLNFIREFNQTYRNGPDLGTRAGQAYRIQGVPETFLVDKDGRIAWVKIGPTNLAEMQAEIEPLLNDD